MSLITVESVLYAMSYDSDVVVGVGDCIHIVDTHTCVSGRDVRTDVCDLNVWECHCTYVRLLMCASL